MRGTSFLYETLPRLLSLWFTSMKSIDKYKQKIKEYKKTVEDWEKNKNSSKNNNNILKLRELLKAIDSITYSLKELNLKLPTYKNK